MFSCCCHVFPERDTLWACVLQVDIPCTFSCDKVVAAVCFMRQLYKYEMKLSQGSSLGGEVNLPRDFLFHSQKPNPSLHPPPCTAVAAGRKTAKWLRGLRRFLRGGFGCLGNLDGFKGVGPLSILRFRVQVWGTSAWSPDSQRINLYGFRV